MLEVLDLGFSYTYMVDVSELVEAAGNSRLKELRLDSHYYYNLPQHIQELYSYLLKRTR